ncbi:MAG: hypothetical protein U0793_06140 [Gemmataceae bacterium]
MAKSSFTFVQLPEDEEAFLTFLETIGEFWARAVGDDPRTPEHEPLPVARFLRRFARRLRSYGSVDIYLGLGDDIRKPPVFAWVQRVAGKRVRHATAHEQAAPFVRYSRGEISDDESLGPAPGEKVLVTSTIGYYRDYYHGKEFVRKPTIFLTWARKLVAWWRHRATQAVSIRQGHDEVLATPAAFEAIQRGGLEVE